MDPLIFQDYLGKYGIRPYREQKVMDPTTERQAWALLHMLEQLRQDLRECVAAHAEPRSIERRSERVDDSLLQTPKPRSTMKDTMGLGLREAWKEQGKSNCHHPEMSKETSFSGTVTGWSVCTTCGHRLPMEPV